MTPEERESLVRALSGRGIRCACVALVEGGLMVIDMEELLDVGKPVQ